MNFDDMTSQERWEMELSDKEDLDSVCSGCKTHPAKFGRKTCTGCRRRVDEHKERAKHMADSWVRAGAMFDETGVYRYRLWRYWETREVPDPLVFLMLNPSTADAEKLDPTVRKCVEIARRMGHCGVEILNIFALKATNPEDMVDSMEAGIDIIGPLNNDAIRATSKGRRLIVACGAHKLVPARLTWLMGSCGLEPRETLCLKKTKDGLPWHPLYVAYATVPQPWSMP